MRSRTRFRPENIKMSISMRRIARTASFVKQSSDAEMEIRLCLGVISETTNVSLETESNQKEQFTENRFNHQASQQ
jgi:hypothetical protein